MKLRLLLLAAVAAVLVAVPALAGDKEGKAAAKGVTIAGELTKVEASAITVATKGKEGAPGVSKTIAVDAETKVFIQTDQTEPVKGEGGATKERPKIVEGALSDLKVGQKVIVGCDPDGAKAVKILVLRPESKVGKEGGEKKEGGQKKDGGDRKYGGEKKYGAKW